MTRQLRAAWLIDAQTIIVKSTGHEHVDSWCFEQYWEQGRHWEIPGYVLADLLDFLGIEPELITGKNAVGKETVRHIDDEDFHFRELPSIVGFPGMRGLGRRTGQNVWIDDLRILDQRENWLELRVAQRGWDSATKQPVGESYVDIVTYSGQYMTWEEET